MRRGELAEEIFAEPPSFRRRAFIIPTCRRHRTFAIILTLDYTVTQTHAHLSLYIDHEADPSFVLPLRISELPIADADGLSWVGFTASTGLASMDVDLLSFAFEQHPE